MSKSWHGSSEMDHGCDEIYDKCPKWMSNIINLYWNDGKQPWIGEPIDLLERLPKQAKQFLYKNIIQTGKDCK